MSEVLYIATAAGVVAVKPGCYQTDPNITLADVQKYVENAIAKGYAVNTATPYHVSFEAFDKLKAESYLHYDLKSGRAMESEAQDKADAEALIHEINYGKFTPTPDMSGSCAALLAAYKDSKWEVRTGEAKCECVAEKVRSNLHSSWCPKHT